MSDRIGDIIMELFTLSLRLQEATQRVDALERAAERAPERSAYNADIQAAKAACDALRATRAALEQEWDIYTGRK